MTALADGSISTVRIGVNQVTLLIKWTWMVQWSTCNWVEEKIKEQSEYIYTQWAHEIQCKIYDGRKNKKMMKEYLSKRWKPRDSMFLGGPNDQEIVQWISIHILPPAKMRFHLPIQTMDECPFLHIVQVKTYNTLTRLMVKRWTGRKRNDTHRKKEYEAGKSKKLYQVP